MNRFIKKCKKDLGFKLALIGLFFVGIIIVLMSFNTVISISIAFILIIPLTWYYLIPMFRLGKIRSRLFILFEIEEKTQNEYVEKYMRRKQ